MSSVVEWRCPQTGVTAVWDKNKGYLVQGPDNYERAGYHSMALAVRAAKIKSWKIRTQYRNPPYLGKLK